jgi:tRNA 5-methylaminomethyl-2-thiouridine biosynthesis bifunctional protein
LFTALGSRGITWSALCAEVLAAAVSGGTMPMEASLLDAIDPARFAVRVWRGAGRARAI